MPLNHADRPLILLVDDMPSNLHLLVAALKDDYRLKTAVNGAAALELAAREDRPDLILLDMMMPGMSGIDVLKELRQQPETASIPVIFVTADTSEQSQLDGLELGADDYLTKPVVTAVLQVRVRNLLQRKRIERELRLASHVFNYSGEAIMITDRDNRIIDVNPAFSRLTGYSLDEVRGANPRLLSSGRTAPEEYQAIWQSIREHDFWQGELWDRRRDGSVYPKLLTISVVRNQRGEIDFHIGSFTDITRQKNVEAEIRHIANHDHLTGLPNRMYLQAALEQTLAMARRDKSEVAVMFVDLDRFKSINDTYGHAVGDGLLIQVADRLKESVRESDLVARLGGDEFVVVATGQDIRNGAATVAMKILSSLSTPYGVDGQTLHSTPSVGISLYPEDGATVEALMKHADQAMYRVKQAGRGHFRFYGDGGQTV
ncbi:two-component system response regulator [Trichlorobacter ammonificans]|uniref:Response regulator receiver modulated diguanylate cyclase with PAS/PAC sensor n=1 Tax=Trichlorobacter ammonificans TaxID=2916410 RepID=A0ABN8HF39_9BACT|nr:diguanylate cyclase [Trichlorobacter ammonificans]CAH2031485.1 Response regulator receiver modulated diguanylate cyclase with PAS/PAC sensor [Trichlorobacter ammonificans]